MNACPQQDHPGPKAIAVCRKIYDQLMKSIHLKTNTIPAMGVCINPFLGPSKTGMRELLPDWPLERGMEMQMWAGIFGDDTTNKLSSFSIHRDQTKAPDCRVLKIFTVGSAYKVQASD